MPYLVDMNTFWCDWQVVSGDTTAFDEYTTFKNGLLMNDGSYVYNMKELCDYQGYGGNRYKLFTYYQQFDDNIYGEYEFYKYTNDPNIYDYRTFWQNAASYLGTTCSGTPFNIAVFGAINTEAFYSSDSGTTFDNTSITIPTPLPSQPQLRIIERSQTQNAYEAYFGTALSLGPSQSRIYKYNFTTKEWTNFYTFSPGKRIDDLLWINASLFYFISQSPTNNISKSTNGGLTFTTSTLSPSFRPEKIDYDPNLNVIVIGGISSTTKRFLYSTNQGLTWNLCNPHIPLQTNQPCTSLKYHASQQVWVATFFSSFGNSGRILVSYDGINWVDNLGGVSGYQFTDSCVNDLTGTIMVSNDNSTLAFKSTTGGATWVPITIPIDNTGHIVCVPDLGSFGRFIMFSNNTGVGVKYHYSDDEGITWTSVATNPLDFHGTRAAIVY